MNTSEVAKLLGVSASTIQRWVKQLGLPMEKNDRGHYYFNEEDIDLLKEIHEKLQTGTFIQDIAPIKEKKNARQGAVRAVENNEALAKLFSKVSELELSLNTKADSVASYQLLQHRREIEDLQDHVKELTQMLELLQMQIREFQGPLKVDNPIVFDPIKAKRKKKNIVSSIFGF